MDLKDGVSLSEICGLHAGYGYLRNDGKRIELDISGNVEEKEYYDRYVIPLFSNYFDIRIKGRYFPSRNTYGFVIRDRKIVDFMHNLGFPYGKKTTTVEVPRFIYESSNKKLSIAFLRGLFDTDGSFCPDRRYAKNYRNFKRTYHYYPRISISTCSIRLSEQISLMLNRLNIGFYIQIYVSNKLTENTKRIIWVVGNKNVESWFNVIGSTNICKLTKYLVWKKYGFCPPRTNLNQRKQILKGKLDPRICYGLVAQSG